MAKHTARAVRRSTRAIRREAAREARAQLFGTGRLI